MAALAASGHQCLTALLSALLAEVRPAVQPVTSHEANFPTWCLDAKEDVQKTVGRVLEARDRPRWHQTNFRGKTSDNTEKHTYPRYWAAWR